MKYLKYIRFVGFLCVYQLGLPCIAADAVNISTASNERTLNTYKFTPEYGIDVDIKPMFEDGVLANIISGTITNHISSECYIELNTVKLRWQRSLNSSPEFILYVACNDNIACVISKLKSLFDDREDVILNTEPKKSNSVFISIELVEFEVWEFPLRFLHSGELEIAVDGCGFIPMISQWVVSEHDAEKDNSEVTLSFVEKKCNFSICQNIDAVKCEEKCGSVDTCSGVLPYFLYQDFLPVRNEINTVCPVSQPQSRLYRGEDIRLKSYTEEWQGARHSREEMAQAGFFYLGVKGISKCFWCGIICKDADCGNGESLLTIHKRLSPSCGFLEGKVIQPEPSAAAQIDGLQLHENRLEGYTNISHGDLNIHVSRAKYPGYSIHLSRQESFKNSGFSNSNIDEIAFKGWFYIGNKIHDRLKVCCFHCGASADNCKNISDLENNHEVTCTVKKMNSK
ncbi:MAG: hypothetical protein QS721_00615 [Candidatus Endonucleobacter sp. (ex Gigantidas childressi)]|nr:hypothetical protein [Candidatus Endonucleobacter sp. (ex Gigantidas childressi)]